MGKSNFNEKDPFTFGNLSRRFSQHSRRLEKGESARDHFAFDQTIKGNDCTRIRKKGDFLVQERDFFGNKIGYPIIYAVKSGSAKLTETELKRKRQLGRDRYKVVRY